MATKKNAEAINVAELEARVVIAELRAREVEAENRLVMAMAKRTGAQIDQKGPPGRKGQTGQGQIQQDQGFGGRVGPRVFSCVCQRRFYQPPSGFVLSGSAGGLP